MNSSQSSESAPLSAAEERRMQQLFRDGAADYLDDAGFTAQVLGRLPVARIQRVRRRLLLVSGAALLGSAIAVVCGGHDMMAALVTGWALLGEWSTRPIPGFETMATVGSAVVLAGSLGTAWWSCSRAE